MSGYTLAGAAALHAGLATLAAGEIAGSMALKSKVYDIADPKDAAIVGGSQGAVAALGFLPILVGGSFASLRLAEFGYEFARSMEGAAPGTAVLTLFGTAGVGIGCSFVGAVAIPVIVGTFVGKKLSDHYGNGISYTDILHLHFPMAKVLSSTTGKTD